MNGVYSDRHIDSSIEGGQRVTRCDSGAKMRSEETCEVATGDEGILQDACRKYISSQEYRDSIAKFTDSSPGDLVARAKVMLARLEGKA